MADDPSPAVDVAALMAELRAEIQAARAPAPPTPPPSTDAIARRVDVLERQATVFERPFLSQVPVLGTAIAGVREGWNSVSTKWYVRPMLQQQNEFNLAVVRLLGDLTRQVAALEGRLAALEAAAARDTAKPNEPEA